MSFHSWEQILDEAKLDGVHTSLGNYDDAEMAALVEAASRRLNLSKAEVLQWFGTRAMPLLKERYGSLFAGHPGSRNFIRSVNKMIHPGWR
ncbi:heme NO-binding domain-containing protein [Methylobacterium tarhaniae]|uniref:heme NO-binding domain-containing protein n=1 Tax=Methylobacterium tarhaniae TaxID=1187852 RepID=UPI00069E2168|nr:heme NO-binding domain-containing protein [Methylobacterium tarhaniae]